MPQGGGWHVDAGPGRSEDLCSCFVFSFLIFNHFCSSLQIMLMLFYNLNNLTSRTNTSLNYKWVNECKQQNAWFELKSKYFRSSPPDPSCTVTCTSRCTVLRTFRTWRGGCPSLSTRYAISIFHSLSRNKTHPTVEGRHRRIRGCPDRQRQVGQDQRDWQLTQPCLGRGLQSGGNF